jgi:hypothetical protein
MNHKYLQKNSAVIHPAGETALFISPFYLFLDSHCWFAMPQDVLQADWQDVWHSPQPPVLALLLRSRVSIVKILLTENILLRKVDFEAIITPRAGVFKSAKSFLCLYPGSQRRIPSRPVEDTTATPASVKPRTARSTAPVTVSPGTTRGIPGG